MNGVTKSSGDRLFNCINSGLLILFGLLVVYPFWHILVLSVSPPYYSNQLGLKLLPPQITFDSYAQVLKDRTLMNAYVVTIIRTVSGTVLALLFCTGAAYALSKEAMPFKKTINWMFIFTAFFSGGLIPTYMLFKSMHLTNTIWALVFPEMLNAFYILVIKSYIVSIPESLEESALMDGAHELVLFFRIILPLCMPIIATIALWSAVYHWNDWYLALFFITDPKYDVLQAVLRKVVVESNVSALAAMTARMYRKNLYTPESIKAAAIVVATGPIVFIYPYAQKFFIQGVYTGSVKG